MLHRRNDCPFGFLFLAIWTLPILTFSRKGEKELFSVSMKELPYTVSVRLGRSKTDSRENGLLRSSPLTGEDNGEGD
jgi:hypothetical protein